MRLGVICDGIDRDLGHAISAMEEFDLGYAELKYVNGTEVGDHSADEIHEMDDLLRDNGISVSCISRAIFADLTCENKANDTQHSAQVDALRRVIDMAHILEAPLVRIMTPKSNQLTLGQTGADRANAMNGAWDAMLHLVEPVCKIAKEAGVQIAVETSARNMVNSAFTARKLIDDLDAKSVMKVLWSPADTCISNEAVVPDGYDLLKDGYIGHIHIRDIKRNQDSPHLATAPLGEGQLGSDLWDLADQLRCDSYAGVVSFEPANPSITGEHNAGFRENVEQFCDYFS